MAHEVLVKAKDHKIDAVTVYHGNRAAIRRTFPVVLNRGQNDVIIQGLPATLDNDSLRVEVQTRSATHGLTLIEVLHMPTETLSEPRRRGTPPSFADDEGDSELKILQETLDDLDLNEKLISTQKKVLTEYARRFGVHSRSSVPITASPEELDAFLRIYEPRQLELRDKEKVIQKDSNRIFKQIKALELAGRKRPIVGDSPASVKIKVLAEEAGPAHVVLSYALPNASWSSLYDVRATTTTDSKEAFSKTPEPTKRLVQIHYQADIAQWTGEDWDGVELTLSTASYRPPQEVPVVQPWRIGGRQPRRYEVNQRRRSPIPYRYRSRSPRRGYSPPGGLFIPTVVHAASPRSRSHSRSRSRSRSRHRSRSAVSVRRRRHHSVSPPREQLYGAKLIEADIQESLIGTAFVISGSSSIPSDSNSHRVSIASVILPAEFEWTCVPRAVTAAFLQCRIENTSSYHLIAGPSNIFMDGSFIAKSTLPEVSSGETFSLSLGVDPSVKVTYHPQKRVVSTSGGGLLGLMSSSKVKVIEFRQRITIRVPRKGSSGIEKLVVTDRTPVSEDARIKVVMLEPSDKVLGPLITNPTSTSPVAGAAATPPPIPPKSKNGSGFSSLLRSAHTNPSAGVPLSRTSSATAVSPKAERNVLVRWAQKDDDAGTASESSPRGDGVIEWIGVNIRDTLELELAYQIVAPIDVLWVDL